MYKYKTNPLFEECVAKADPATMKEVSENVDKMLNTPKPTLPGLNEVAEGRFDDVFYKFLDKKDKEVSIWSEEDLLELAKYMFDFGKKVGAEWMAGQGVTEESLVFCDEDDRLFVQVFVKEPFKMADNIIVQIRKK